MRIYTLRKTTTLAVLLALALALLGAFTLLSEKPVGAGEPIVDPGQETTENHVIPDLVQGNPSCSDLGDYRSIKDDGDPVTGQVPEGTFPSADGYLSATVSNIHTIPDVGQVFDWTSTGGIDKVIAKGGNAADAYVYTPEDNGDKTLHAPVNPDNANGTYYDLSHIDFCYDVEPQVSKTADTSFKKTYKWTITKSANPTDLDLVTGQSGNAGYTVTVTKDNGTDSEWAVSGKITVTNPLNNQSITIKSITDALSTSNTSPTITGCNLPATLAPNASLECSYSASPGNGTSGTNTATVVSDTAGVGDGVGKADYAFVNPTTKVNDSITVNDDFGTPAKATDDKSFSFTDSGSEQYNKTIGPFDKCGDQTVTNTATMSPASAASGASSASATVTAHVKCQLTVVKDLVPDTDSGKFNLLINGETKAANVGDGGTTGPQAFAPGSSPISVSETAGTGTTPSDYVSTIKCDGADVVSGTSTTVSFASGDSDKTCTITNTRKGKAEVVKKVNGAVPAAGQTFTFELRKDASITSEGVPPLETKTTDSSGKIAFATLLVPGQTYQICEWVMPGWNTNLSGDGSLFVPGSMLSTMPPLPNQNVNNMTVCTNFTVGAGQTRTFNVDNTPPPGGRALTIGFWKNWASCNGAGGTSGGKQKAMLDLALANASKQTANPPGGLVVSADTSSPPTLWPNYTATWSLVLKGDPASTNSNIKPAPDCAKAVNLLNKSTTDGKKKMASDPLFNMTAQLVAAQLNRFMGAGISPATIQNIDNAVLLNGKYNFDGNTYSPKLTTADTNRANCLATQLDNYNNDRPVSLCT